MVQYLHFRILKFPLNAISHHSTGRHRTALSRSAGFQEGRSLLVADGGRRLLRRQGDLVGVLRDLNPAISEAPVRESVQLVPITPISRTGLWYANNELVTGANLNQRSHHWGASHCGNKPKWLYSIRWEWSTATTGTTWRISWSMQSGLVGGDWNHGILWLSIYIGNVIIPTDFRIFFRGVGQPPTWGDGNDL